MEINTEYGVFEVSANGDKGSLLLQNGKIVASLPKVYWWDADGIRIAIKENEEEILKGVERVKSNNLSVTRENAAEVMRMLAEVLGNEEKGFYKSRLNQCINKLSLSA